MTEPSLTHSVSLFHSLGDETVKQGTDNRNTIRNSPETSSLKVLANKALQRNKARNNHETNPLNGVSPPCLPETKQREEFILPSVIEGYEERVAIAEYDGGQCINHARRIAYNSAFVEYINAHPTESIIAAQDFLMTQGIPQPE